MPQPNDLSRSLVALDQNSTIIAVVELSQSSWLVGEHPCQMIVKGIDWRRIWRMAELLAVRSRQRPKIIIEDVILFNDDHDVFDWHSNLPGGRGLLRGQSP